MWKLWIINVWDKFNKLTILKEIEKSGKLRMVRCVCECGWKKDVSMVGIKSWHTKSCWCLRRGHIRHGMHGTRIYKIFMDMKSRCNNKNDTSYRNYWWKWIAVEWGSFELFYKDMWSAYKQCANKILEKDVTIERVDVYWNYCKSNCIWISKKQQADNKSNTHHITHKWAKLNIEQREKRLGMRKWVLRMEIFRGWTIGVAIKNKEIYDSRCYDVVWIRNKILKHIGISWTSKVKFCRLSGLWKTTLYGILRLEYKYINIHAVNKIDAYITKWTEELF